MAADLKKIIYPDLDVTSISVEFAKGVPACQLNQWLGGENWKIEYVGWSDFALRLRSNPDTFPRIGFLGAKLPPCPTFK